MNAQVRILVVGKSGCGKSALVRMLIDNDPSDRGGFLITHMRQDLPLVVYENNGTDAAGNDLLIAEVKASLHHRLPDVDASHRKIQGSVHAVWYAFSSVDEHVLNDGGLLQMLGRLGKELPLLLVMTHEEDRLISMKEKRIPSKEEEVVVEEVLGSISDSERREILKASMVRIGRKEDVWDVEGMRLLYTRSMALMGEELWSTWTFIMGDTPAQRRKQRTKVLVVGEEREDVEEFLRSVTNTDAPHREDREPGNEKLEMAVWESTEPLIAFHQPLHINPLPHPSHDQIEPAAIHPFDVRSPIRAKLKVDLPVHANCVESWRKWLRMDGIQLCVLILSFNETDMFIHAEARLQRFLRHYYGLRDIFASELKLAACSPVPLLIVHSGNEREQQLLMSMVSDPLGQVVNARRGGYVDVVKRHTLSSEKDETAAAAVREFLQRNVIHGCITIRPKLGALVSELNSIMAKMSEMMRKFYSWGGMFYDFGLPWLFWNYVQMEEIVCRRLPLLRRRQQQRTLGLGILCIIWRVPPKLKQVLATFSTSNRVQKSFILCIILFCKWKCNDKILCFEIAETTKYYRDMIEEALNECHNLHERLFKVEANREGGCAMSN